MDGVAGWSLWAANSPGMGDDATRVTYSGIVDERRFYAQATGHAHPLTAADYLDYPRMRAVLVALNNTPEGALLLPSGNYDQWDLVPPISPEHTAGRPAGLPGPPQKGPHTVFFTNLGMVGMNVGLDVRVIDQIGLANPVAAHTARLQHGRIGHDKNLFPDWVIADGPWVKWYPGVPGYLDAQWVAQAEAALRCPATQSMLSSVRAPMGLHRFVSNFLNSYRIHQVPNRPGSALRTHPMRPGRAGARRCSVHRSAGYRALAGRIVTSASDRQRIFRRSVGLRRRLQQPPRPAPSNAAYVVLPAGDRSSAHSQTW